MPSCLVENGYAYIYDLKCIPALSYTLGEFCKLCRIIVPETFDKQSLLSKRVTSAKIASDGWIITEYNEIIHLQYLRDCEFILQSTVDELETSTKTGHMAISDNVDVDVMDVDVQLTHTHGNQNTTFKLYKNKIRTITYNHILQPDESIDKLDIKYISRDIICPRTIIVVHEKDGHLYARKFFVRMIPHSGDLQLHDYESTFKYDDIPAKNIELAPHIYSFALHPEDHVPSGSINISRVPLTRRICFERCPNDTDTLIEVYLMNIGRLGSKNSRLVFTDMETKN